MNIDRAALLAAMEEGHDFPGFYPFIVIARNSGDFYNVLLAAIEEEQRGAPYDIAVRESSAKNYISYKIQMFVLDAESALDRKIFLQRIPGVLLLL